jgi:nitric oxide reductase subunit B
MSLALAVLLSRYSGRWPPFPGSALPGYWQWVGSIFSTFEVIPFLPAAFVSLEGPAQSPNKAAFFGRWKQNTPLPPLALGCLGFLHTARWPNFYSHGTQITAAHECRFTTPMSREFGVICRGTAIAGREL